MLSRPPTLFSFAIFSHVSLLPCFFFFFFLKQEASNLPPPLYLFIIFFEDSNIQPNTHPRRYRTTSPTPIHQVCCLLCLSHVHIDVFQLIYNFLTLYTPSYFFFFLTNSLSNFPLLTNRYETIYDGLVLELKLRSFWYLLVQPN